jgi:ribosomal protein L37AE/L43A
MNSCPCCSSQLLRHARQNRVYWFCSHCWQEMPDLSEMVLGNSGRTHKLDSLVKLSGLTPKLKVLNSVGVT